MDELRWFLLILGLLVIGAVVLYSYWQDWRQDGPPWRRRRRTGREPFAEEGLDDDLRGDLEELDSVIAEQRGDTPAPGDDLEEGVIGPSRPVGEPSREPESRASSEPAPEPDPAPGPPPEPRQEQLFDSEPGVAATPESSRKESTAKAGPGDEDQAEGGAAGTRAARRSVAGAFQSRMRQALGSDEAEPAPAADPDEPAEAAAPPDGEEKLIVLTVMAPDDAVFAGEALVPLLEECGLRYGEHRIYHRTLETRQGTVSLYSVANIVEPGCLDREHMDDYTTPGVALFMQLPGPFDGLAAFEQMLHTARTLAERLGGHLLDSRRGDLTQQSIEHIREELVEYRRRARLAARRART